MITVKIETFVTEVDQFNNILFINNCCHVETGQLQGDLKLFVGAEALCSQICLQLLKKVKFTSVSLLIHLVKSENKIYRNDRFAPLSIFIVSIS
ncbi:hypothetical protein AVEN_117212-1 [Araneus ventricosus]|uniref:Uncharacterized protein n=1 Tax=Araneus ventricosus TaxID=182803 RepID=A0A4Y2AZJ9_ARAVE|nr:hypothetical protein AVEN_117212-1 [Araneus ventricosus]